MITFDWLEIRTNFQKRLTNIWHESTHITPLFATREAEEERGTHFYDICENGDDDRRGADDRTDNRDMSIASVRCSTVVERRRICAPIVIGSEQSRQERRRGHTYAYVCIPCIGIADKWRPARRSEISRTRDTRRRCAPDHDHYTDKWRRGFPRVARARQRTRVRSVLASERAAAARDETECEGHKGHPSPRCTII